MTLPTPSPTGAPPGVRHAFPPSYAQRRLWFIHQLDPERATYNVPLFLRLTGTLDRAALARALQALVERHEGLRTTFPARDGEPVQQVHPAPRLVLPQVDLSRLEPVARHAAARALRQQAATRPFDLANGPLARFLLVRTGAGGHELLITLHHIVTDAWSRGVLLRELEQLYAAFTAGRPSPLPALTIQPADHAVWQREWLRGAAGERQSAYWARRLAQVPALDLPTDYARSAATHRPEGTLTLRVPRAVCERLSALAQAEDATLFMVLLAAFHWLLGLHARQDDVAVGTAIANRRRKQTQDLVGFLVNTLVIRADLRGAPSLRALLRRVRASAVEAYAHQDLPFERLVEELNPPRLLGRTPLFQAMFTLEDATSAPRDWSGLRVEEAGGDVELEGAKFELMLALAPDADGLQGSVSYAVDLFARDSIECLSAHYVRLLEDASARPDAPLASLRLAGPDERRRLLEEWNRTEREFPAECGVHELFERRAALHPGAPAVVHGSTRASYAELNQAADHLARRLRAQGVGPEVRVGLCVERGLDMVVAVLAILKAGGAYVPLDPTYPDERLTLMLDDSQAALVLAAPRFTHLFERAGARVLALPGDEPAGLAEAHESAPRAGGGALAYMMYTSGSTGTPKGILIEHRAIARLVIHGDYVEVAPGWRVAQVSNISFDAATFELWGALLNGATLVVIDQDVVLSPSGLARALRDERIDVMFLTTALFNQMASEAPGAFGGMHSLLFGGEAADPRRVADVLRDGPPRRLLHVYGPTETTTFATWHELRAVEPHRLSLPIGNPITNTRAYVLDDDLEPVPPGLPGELYIGGPGVARGYWSRPALTAERFVPDPFSTRPGARLYRSGDLVRRRAGSGLEFMQRLDGQVKLRGFRIETGEIEACLRQHATVADARVVLRDDDGDKRLVGYLVARPEAQPPVGEIKQHLQRRLPEYMLPAAFVVLEALPLNANGKLDRRALPAPGRDEHSRREYVAPRSELETRLAQVWAETLKLDRVGAGDDFFDLGGHSLLATRLVSRVRSDFSLELPLRALFEQPTLEGFAGVVREHLSRATTGDTTPLVKVERGGALPLSPAQRRLWFLQQLEPGSGAYNVPLFLRLTGALDAPALEWSWSEIVRRHEVLRSAFPVRQGEPWQEIQPPRAVPLPRVDLSALPPGLRARAAAQVRQALADTPFDLGRGPVWRVALLRLDERRHEWLLTLHHVLTDGWSEGVLVGELRELYEARRAGRPARLPELGVQYADYAAWQQARLAGGALAPQVEYWRRQLAGVPVLDLPTDRPRPPAAAHPQASLPLHLPLPLTRALKSVAQAESATLFMVLLAAFQWLLGRYARQSDVAVGTVIANRGRREIENLVGFFVNTLVMRTDTSGRPSLRALVRRVRETALQAYANQEVSFEKLVEELNPARDLGRTPFFQAMFVLQNLPSGDWELPELHVTELEIELRDAKFELNLTLAETTEGLAGRLSYAADLFDAASLDQLLRHYAALLEQAVARPDEALNTLPLIAEDERRRVIVEWNQTRRPYPREGSLVELVEGWARDTPRAAAVVHDGVPLEYAELERRANRLARHLAQRGARRETRVAVCLERGLEWAVALLAVWKAGAAYVPLDTAYPRERLAFMLADAGVGLIVTDQALRDELPAHDTVVCLDLDWEAIERHGDEPLGVTLPGRSLAYVMYTSGSTGKPKGVMIEHAGMTNHLWAKVLDLGLHAGDVVGQNAPASFDISVWQLLAAWLVGARVEIFSDELSRDGRRLLNEVDACGVTVLETVPSLLAAMLEPHGRGALPPRLERLRCLISNAEALPVALGEQWLARYPHVRLINTYGATECSDDVTHHVVQPGARRGSAYVALGVPLANLTSYVLDDELRPLPFGVAGELCLGGAGVGRGYLNRPLLTAARFVPDPFSEQPGSRLYRTGDLGRLNRDRSLEFLGRIDFQVKVRGHRVELGEIEEALLEHEAVTQAVVLLREDTPGLPRLAAYVVARPGTDVEALPARLAAFLAARLPDPMLPAAYVSLDAMPLTVNGKVDRRALPAPEGGAARADTYVAPRNELETLLCHLWEQLLHVSPVGIHDNFFGLGGHSLLATQVIARLHGVLRVDVPLAALFRAPNVAAFALEVESARHRVEPAPIARADRAAMRAARAARHTAPRRPSQTAPDEG